MNSIHSLMQCIFSFDIVKNIAYASFSWDNNSLFIVFEIIFVLDYL